MEKLEIELKKDIKLIGIAKDKEQLKQLSNGIKEFNKGFHLFFPSKKARDRRPTKLVALVNTIIPNAISIAPMDGRITKVLGKVYDDKGNLIAYKGNIERDNKYVLSTINHDYVVHCKENEDIRNLFNSY